MRYLIFRLKRFCGFAVGFVFFVSGLLKLMDPVGAGLVMQEYFKFLHIGFLEPIAKGSAVALAFIESITGAALVTGVWRKLVAPVATGLQGFFTLLTLLLIIFKPEMDCGCFGEAIHMTHGQTFGKNLILLTALLIYYIPTKYLGETKKKKYVSFAVVSLSTAAFALYSLLYIPMADFTDLKAGTQINKDNRGEDAYEAVFIYSKSDKEESFTLENIPDTTWTFVRTETTGITNTKTASAVISIIDNNGEYADSLLTEGKIIAISLYKRDMTEKDIRKLYSFTHEVRKTGFTPVILSAQPLSNLDAPVFMCDHKTLMTLNRSNGGATYINNRFIIRKWAKKTLPDLKELTTLSEEDPTDTFIGHKAKTSLAFQGFLLYVFAVMLLL